MTDLPVLLPDAPAPAEPRPFHFPAIDRDDAEGVHVRAVHLPDRPLTRMIVVVDAGARAEPDGAWGVAALISRALQRGAAGLGAHDLAVAFERLGAFPRASSGRDAAEVELTVAPARVVEAADLLAEMVRRPTLATDDLIEVRSTLVDEHLAALAEPATKADRALSAAVWDPACRLSVGGAGSERTVAAIEPDTIRDFHAARWAGGRLTLVLVGDLTGLDVGGVAGRFSSRVHDLADDATVVANAGPRRIHLVEVAGAAQSQIAFGRPGPPHGHDGSEALDVALSATAGSFSSRLNTRLREELGYTYGVRASMSRWRDVGMLSSSFSVRTEVTAHALEETLAVFDRALADGLDDAEVDQARANLVRRVSVGLDGPAAIASAVAGLVVHGLPDDHYEQRLERLHAVDPAQAVQALRDHVRTDDLQLVVVGDAGVRGGLQDLGVGAVVGQVAP